MAKTGRPKGENNKEHVCTIRLDDNQWRRLEAYCEKLGMIKSDAIRLALDKVVSEKDGDK